MLSTTTTHNLMFDMVFRRGRKVQRFQRFASSHAAAAADAARLASGDMRGWSVVSVTHVASLVAFA